MRPLLRLGRGLGVQVATLVLLSVVLAAAIPGFSGVPAVYGVLEGLPLVGIAAIGLAVTMIAGELDLSIGSMAALCGIVAVHASDAGLVPALLAGTATGAVLGGVQGWMIARLRISSLVLTVGTLIVFQGAALMITGGRTIGVSVLETTDPLLLQWGVLSPSSVVAIVVIFAVGVFLARTRWGREIYAIGGARDEAVAAGVPVRPSLVLAFGLSGACAALAGSLACLQGGSADPNGFSTLLLGAASAALIGGISLYGGRGGAVNVALGALILAVVSAAATAAAAPLFVTGLSTGALLLAVISVDSLLGRTLSARRLRRIREERRERFEPATHEAEPFTPTR